MPTQVLRSSSEILPRMICGTSRNCRCDTCSPRRTRRRRVREDAPYAARTRAGRRGAAQACGSCLDRPTGEHGRGARGGVRARWGCLGKELRRRGSLRRDALKVQRGRTELEERGVADVVEDDGDNFLRDKDREVPLLPCTATHEWVRTGCASVRTGHTSTAGEWTMFQTRGHGVFRA